MERMPSEHSPEISPANIKETERKRTTHLMLKFVRHGEKDPNTVEPKKPEKSLLLTEKGRRQAVEKGLTVKPDVNVSVGRYSNRARTDDTVKRLILAEQIEDPNVSFEELNNAIEQALVAGERKDKKLPAVRKKTAQSNLLNFDLDTGPTGKKIMEAFKAGNFIPYLVDQSDSEARKDGDLTTTTYSRFAGNIAEQISKYTRLGNNFNRLTAEKDFGRKYGDRLERYLGTHQGVSESFVIKLLEVLGRQSGGERFEQKRQVFIKGVGKGFAETEGITIQIDNRGAEQTISVAFELDGKEETIQISHEVLNEIIKDRDDMNAEISAAIEAKKQE